MFEKYVHKLTEKREGTDFISFHIGLEGDNGYFGESVYMWEDDFSINASLAELFYKHVKGFEYYDISVVTKAQWEKIIEELPEVDEETKIALFELNEWTKRAFEVYDYFVTKGP